MKEDTQLVNGRQSHTERKSQAKRESGDEEHFLLGRSRRRKESDENSET